MKTRLKLNQTYNKTSTQFEKTLGKMNTAPMLGSGNLCVRLLAVNQNDLSCWQLLWETGMAQPLVPQELLCVWSDLPGVVT